MGDVLTIDNSSFEQIERQTYPAKLQLNSTKYFDNQAAFLDLYLSILNGIRLSKLNDKRDDYNFEIVY